MPDSHATQRQRAESLNYRPGGFHPVHLQDHFKKDRYHVIHKLGHGGFATVWLARDAIRHRYVALKILAARLSDDCPEVEILRRLKSAPDTIGKSYVMCLFDHFWINGPNGRHLCVVSQVAGPSIKQFNHCPGLVSGSRRLRAAIGRKVALQAVEGLSYIHSNGVVHGDFTSSNILLRITNINKWSEEELYARLGRPRTQSLDQSSSKELIGSAPNYTIQAIDMGRVDPHWFLARIIIIDFGIAFLQEQSSPHIGTPKSYCAPEFQFHHRRDFSSDIWALGCTIYEIRTGSPLFRHLGKQTRSQILMTFVKALGPLPEQWMARWDEGRDWYDREVKSGGELFNDAHGRLYHLILNTKTLDGETSLEVSIQYGQRSGSEHEDEIGLGTTDRLVALVGKITTSEAEDIVAANYDQTDPQESKNVKSRPRSESGKEVRSGDTSMPSSNSKSGEKSIYSEGVSNVSSTDSSNEQADRMESASGTGAESLSRLHLESINELPEIENEAGFLELFGTQISAEEATGLESLLRKALMFLPEDRPSPLELAKDRWFAGDYQE